MGKFMLCATIALLYFFSGFCIAHSHYQSKDDPQVGGFNGVLFFVLFCIASYLIFLLAYAD